MKEFEDQVLNFSLRVIVCETFFNLKFERAFFKRENINVYTLNFLYAIGIDITPY
jgi:hypothetical protein